MKCFFVQMNILETGEVCMEFVKNKGKEQRVVEVFSISADGQQVGNLLTVDNVVFFSCKILKRIIRIISYSLLGSRKVTFHCGHCFFHHAKS